MSSLTDQERRGLEEVFLSITPRRKQTLLQRIKTTIDLWFTQKPLFHRETNFSFFKNVKKMPKIGIFKQKYLKKKKSLS